MNAENIKIKLLENYENSNKENSFRDYVQTELENIPESFDSFFSKSWDELNNEERKEREEFIMETIGETEIEIDRLEDGIYIASFYDESCDQSFENVEVIYYYSGIYVKQNNGSFYGIHLVDDVTVTRFDFVKPLDESKYDFDQEYEIIPLS